MVLFWAPDVDMLAKKKNKENEKQIALFFRWMRKNRNEKAEWVLCPFSSYDQVNEWMVVKQRVVHVYGLFKQREVGNSK